MRKIAGMGLVVVLALGVGSYALGDSGSAKGRSLTDSGQMMSSGGMTGQGMMGRGDMMKPGMMGQGGMMGSSGMMGMGRSMMAGGTNFIDMCRTMITGWLGTTDSSAPEDPYSRKGRGAPRTERGMQ